jgi:exopolysaccharide biosynthesis protein
LKKFFASKAFPFIYGAILTAFTLFVVLDAFVIPRSYASASAAESSSAQTVQTSSSSGSSSGTASTLSSSAATTTDTSYSDGNITIKITTDRVDGTTVYVADIQVTSVEYLKAALAGSTYGKNVTAVTSSIASSNNAILAINGDYYGARDSGYVVRKRHPVPLGLGRKRSGGFGGVLRRLLRHC